MKRMLLLAMWIAVAPMAIAAPADTTKSAPAPAAAKPAPPVRYVILIRHGDYNYVEGDDRVVNGLNAMGHAQARYAGERLKGMPVKMTRLYCSDFTRARETADDIGAILGIPAVRDTLLRECTPTNDRADIMKGEKPEDVAACEAQLDAAWKAHMIPAVTADEHDVLVCHGNVIRWWIARTLGMDMKKWISMDIGNGSLTVVAVRSDGTPRLVSYSDVGHLPVDAQTWSGRGAGWNARDKR